MDRSAILNHSITVALTPSPAKTETSKFTFKSKEDLSTFKVLKSQTPRPRKFELSGLVNNADTSPKCRLNETINKRLQRSGIWDDAVRDGTGFTTEDKVGDLLDDIDNQVPTCEVPQAASTPNSKSLKFLSQFKHTKPSIKMASELRGAAPSSRTCDATSEMKTEELNMPSNAKDKKSSDHDTRNPSKKVEVSKTSSPDDSTAQTPAETPLSGGRLSEKTMSKLSRFAFLETPKTSPSTAATCGSAEALENAVDSVESSNTSNLPRSMSDDTNKAIRSKSDVKPVNMFRLSSSIVGDESFNTSLDSESLLRDIEPPKSNLLRAVNTTTLKTTRPANTNNKLLQACKLVSNIRDSSQSTESNPTFQRTFKFRSKGGASRTLGTQNAQTPSPPPVSPLEGSRATLTSAPKVGESPRCPAMFYEESPGLSRLTGALTMKESPGISKLSGAWSNKMSPAISPSVPRVGAFASPFGASMFSIDDELNDDDLELDWNEPVHKKVKR